MKQIILFFVLLTIGAIGGLAAIEIKAFLFDESVENTLKLARTDKAITKVLTTVEELKDEIDELNQKISEKDNMISEINEIIDTNTRNQGSVSSDIQAGTPVNNENLQKQVNELRGQLKAIQQYIGESVEEHFERTEKEKAAEKKAKMKAQMSKIAESMKKQQIKTAVKHADKIRKELGLNESQYENIKSALLERAEKYSNAMPIISDLTNDGSENFSDRISEIQKEWESEAKSILTPQQYKRFIKKKLNKVGGFVVMESTLIE